MTCRISSNFNQKILLNLFLGLAMMQLVSMQIPFGSQHRVVATCAIVSVLYENGVRVQVRNTNLNWTKHPPGF